MAIGSQLMTSWKAIPPSLFFQGRCCNSLVKKEFYQILWSRFSWALSYNVQHFFQVVQVSFGYFGGFVLCYVVVYEAFIGFIYYFWCQCISVKVYDAWYSLSLHFKHPNKIKTKNQRSLTPNCIIHNSQFVELTTQNSTKLIVRAFEHKNLHTIHSQMQVPQHKKQRKYTRALETQVKK